MPTDEVLAVIRKANKPLTVKEISQMLSAEHPLKTIYENLYRLSKYNEIELIRDDRNLMVISRDNVIVRHLVKKIDMLEHELEHYKKKAKMMERNLKWYRKITTNGL